MLELLVKKQPRTAQSKHSPAQGQQQREEKRPGSAVPTKPRTNWRSLFVIDVRSLAVFRVAIGVLLLADVAIRAGDLNVMYTDEGMFPRAEIRRLATSVWNWSFHFASGAPSYQGVLLGIAACLALALVAGFGTRLAVVGSWLMLVSIHHRVPPILSGAEILLRVLLFWAMFLPLGRVWSVDHWRKKRRGDSGVQHNHVLSAASAAILLQMGLMYLFSALFKFNGDWFRGEAVAGTLAHDFYASEFGPSVLRFPGLLKGMTWGTLILELAAPFLLFCRRWKMRVGLIAALAVMHLAIGFFLEVGLFSYVAMAGLALFLPTEFWNTPLLARFSPTTNQAQPSVYPHAGRQMAQGRPKLSYLARVACVVLLVYVFAVNINGLPGKPLRPLTPERWKPFATGLGLGQRWGMFEAIPSKDGWYVTRAKLKDGSEVDLLRGGAAVDWKRPAFPAGMYPNHYWQKLFREMAYDDEQGFQRLRPMVAKYLCRAWNARNGPAKQVTEFEMIYCMAGEGKSADGATEVFRERLVYLDLK
jgi:hypothetical protein